MVVMMEIIIVKHPVAEGKDLEVEDEEVVGAEEEGWVLDCPL